MTTKIQRLSRRQAMARAAVLAGAALSGDRPPALPADSKTGEPRTGRGFVFCINTATIRGQKLGIVKELEIASRAGYQAIETWIDAIQEYKRQGGSLPDLKRRVADLGLSVESAIGFPQWIVDDADRRGEGPGEGGVEGGCGGG